MKIQASMFEIDQHALDKEWLRQPVLYHEVASLLVDANAATDRAKARISVEEAELDAAIRQDPDDFGLAKITVDGVRNTIVSHPDYKAAVRDHLDCKHKADLLFAARSALDHKKSALQALVSLHGQDYFSAPSTDAAGHEALDEVTKTSTRRRRRPRGDS